MVLRNCVLLYTVGQNQKRSGMQGRAEMQRIQMSPHQNPRPGRSSLPYLIRTAFGRSRYRFAGFGDFA